MTASHIPGGTSTGSKRVEAFLGEHVDPDFPRAMRRAAGARVWDDRGREYLDFVMGLGAVTLGYGHPAVTEAARAAVADGITGPVPPVEEATLAGMLCDLLPGVAQVRFLKTGAEATAAAVRIARTATGRARVLTCGYHGWHDWCQRGPGVPEAVSALTSTIPFNDVEVGRRAIRGGDVACVVVEPVIDGPPDPRWLSMLREETGAAGSVLVFDEIKTAFRIAPGGAAGRYGIVPDLQVLGKGLANGFPLAAVGGSADLMTALDRTWVSSTLATEQVALRAAIETVRISVAEGVPAVLHETGSALYRGLERLCGEFAALGPVVRGIPEMCYLAFPDQALGGRLCAAMATRGILWKPTAYDFVSLAHTAADVERTLTALGEALGRLSGPG